MANAELIWTKVQRQRLSADERPGFAGMAESVLLAGHVPHDAVLAPRKYGQDYVRYSRWRLRLAQADIHWVRLRRARHSECRNHREEHLVPDNSSLRRTRFISH